MAPGKNVVLAKCWQQLSFLAVEPIVDDSGDETAQQARHVTCQTDAASETQEYSWAYKDGQKQQGGFIRPVPFLRIKHQATKRISEHSHDGS